MPSERVAFSLRRKRLVPILIVAGFLYFVAAMLTLGYGVNRNCMWQRGGINQHCEPAAAVAAPMFFAWPLYWSARAAMEVTKP